MQVRNKNYQTDRLKQNSNIIRLALGGVFFFLSSLAQAQIIFEPDILALELKRNEVIEAVIKISNDSKAAETIFLSLEYRKTAKYASEISWWTKIEPTQIRLGPGASTLVTIHLDSHRCRQKEEMVLAVFAGVRRDNGIKLDLRVGMPIFVRWAGKGTARGKISNVFYKTSSEKLHVSVAILNRGNLHLVPYGLAWIEDAKRQRVWQSDLKIDQPIFPGESSTISLTSRIPKIPRTGKLLVQMFWANSYGIENMGVPSYEVYRTHLRTLRHN